MINFPVRFAQLRPDESLNTLDGLFSYDSRDPYAVTMTIRQGMKYVPWILGRDLLAEGLVRRCGEGDVMIAPEGDRVMITLISHEGHAILYARRSQVQAFLGLTFTVAPRGHELDGIDLEAELARLFGEAA